MHAVPVLRDGFFYLVWDYKAVACCMGHSFFFFFFALSLVTDVDELRVNWHLPDTESNNNKNKKKKKLFGACLMCSGNRGSSWHAHFLFPSSYK